MPKSYRHLTGHGETRAARRELRELRAPASEVFSSGRIPEQSKSLSAKTLLTVQDRRGRSVAHPTLSVANPAAAFASALFLFTPLPVTGKHLAVDWHQ